MNATLVKPEQILAEETLDKNPAEQRSESARTEFEFTLAALRGLEWRIAPQHRGINE